MPKMWYIIYFHRCVFSKLITLIRQNDSKPNFIFLFLQKLLKSTTRLLMLMFNLWLSILIRENTPNFYFQVSNSFNDSTKYLNMTLLKRNAKQLKWNIEKCTNRWK